MPEWQTSACKHRYNPLSTGTQHATAATETPLSLAITHPSINSIPSSTLTVFKDDVRDNLCRYALLEKPIWSRNDTAHIKKVVANFTKVYFLIEADTFKSVACISVQDSYSLWIPIYQLLNLLSATIENHIKELLQDWHYVDEDMTLPLGKHIHGIFNHCTIISIIQDVVWLPSGKFSRLIPADINNIDCLLAFTATVICWALHSLKRGQESDFETAAYHPYYEEALGCINHIRSLGPNNIQLQCLNVTTSQLLQHRMELMELSQ
ncbi:hypothetical protein SCLCIDRAFT_11645 [Scleroderma citrinum Foug A]|uniref:DUF6532 domain-containing protein n=1 Tax=Scleroderma citrinum Foug A TaxID=1036808 RepID=A0A0C3DAS6_9AGAM|nr:hypothetical protein SCLCIDRAFT_11645 [Scleroderma citrinum Foug A]